MGVHWGVWAGLVVGLIALASACLWLWIRQGHTVAYLDAATRRARLLESRRGLGATSDSESGSGSESDDEPVDGVGADAMPARRVRKNRSE